jgi:predicted acylesterase/phospholipase RssA
VEERRRALAFSGGAFDTIMQLGAAHALLVADAAAPDYVVGVSAGAINAAALAEILQAGHGLPNRTDAQVDTLRKFLNAYREVPGELMDAIVPDALEILAKDPLAPLRTPIHPKEERDQRERANHARAGLVRLLNDLWRLRLTVGTTTRIVRRLLSAKEAGALSGRARIGAYLKAGRGLVGLGWRHPVQIASIFWDVLGAIARRPPKTPRRSAADIVFRFRTVRRLWRTIFRGVKVVSFIPLWPIAVVVSATTSSERRARLVTRVLAHYEIADGIANTDVITQQLVRCFDPEYYGRPDIGAIVEAAFQGADAAPPATSAPLQLSEYSRRSPAILVAPVAADAATGDLTIIDQEVPIVDALTAAVATVPFFPPRTITINGREHTFIDGLNVSNEALAPLLSYVRRHPTTGNVLDIYPVTPFPVTQGMVNEDKDTYDGLLAVASRALQLRRFRDATMEQRLTRLHTRVLPSGSMTTAVNGHTYVRANVYPLEPMQPLRINARVFSGETGQPLSTILEQTVADGCRVTLEGIIPDSVRTAAGAAQSVRCHTAIAQRQGPGAGLPGNDAQMGPGLPEICRHCTLHRDKPNPLEQYQLRACGDRNTWPEWPRPEERTTRSPGAPSEKPTQAITLAPGWPSKRGDLRGNERPLVSLLFGGGVFRGVFHMGVANALVQAGLAPDLVAGSSVGSIVAAMIAEIFTLPRPAQNAQVTRLAATFLAMDRLILTDRLADFIRRFTLRAAETEFSPHDLDHVIRRYDLDASGTFDRRVRRVMAGFERLGYVNPFELVAMIRAGRAGDNVTLNRLIRATVQRFLDRSGVGQEILGAEPLALLISEHVLRPLIASSTNHANDDLFETFTDRAIYFLATATNLRQGKLAILGAPTTPPHAGLLYGLLASSAFPSVFRPRFSWEIFRDATSMEQYIDGGTIDNLPLDAVTRFLDQASTGLPKRVDRRPEVGGKPVPHLLFTASLEVDRTEMPAQSVAALNCFELARRAATFTYNRKIDAYQETQAALRAIYRATSVTPDPNRWVPVDLHVTAVRPRWLCDTFGFHPMLGFRRQKQAESIAHGCAMTIGTLFREAKDHPDWIAAWGISSFVASITPSTVSIGTRTTKDIILLPQRTEKKAGDCWFRKNTQCPFSPKALKTQRAEFPKSVGAESAARLAEIYERCGNPQTHAPAPSTNR